MQLQSAGLTQKRSVRLLLLSLAMILAGDIGAYLVKTAAGTVDVVGFKILSMANYQFCLSARVFDLLIPLPECAISQFYSFI